MNYSKIYDKLIKYRVDNPPTDEYTEKHHIIPRCLGGLDLPSNLVILTAREHYTCHQLLTKMHPTHVGLAYAALLMTFNGPDHNRSNNRIYGWVKERYSKLQSIQQLGCNNTQYGTMWVNEIGTVNNKKVRKDSILEDGWQRGRKFVLETTKDVKRKETPDRKAVRDKIVKDKWTDLHREWFHSGLPVNTFMKNKGYCGAGTATRMWEKYGLYKQKKHNKARKSSKQVLV